MQAAAVVAVVGLPQTSLSKNRTVLARDLLGWSQKNLTIAKQGGLRPQTVMYFLCIGSLDETSKFGCALKRN